MIIEVAPSWSRVLQATDDERLWLDEYTSCNHVWYRPTGGRPERVEDVYRMLNGRGVFPSGFVELVRSAARRDGVELHVIDKGGAPLSSVDGEADLGWLRWYQHEAVARCAERGRGLVKLPTGSGKTEIFVGLTRVLPVEWLFAVHRTDLVAQAADRYRLRTGETAGLFEGGIWRRGTANVTVSTFQALWHHIKERSPGWIELARAIGALAVDEVHAQPAESFYRCTQRLARARYRFGFSGTPLDRGEVSSLRTIGAIGPIIYTLPHQRLVEEGVLAAPEITMVRLEQHSAGAASWQEVYRDLVTRSAERNDLVCRMVERARKPALVFVNHIVHGRELEGMLRARGLRAEFAQGDDSLDSRQRKVRRLARGHHDVLVCTVIFQEGIDIPELGSVVNAGGLESVVATLQRIGRGMRVAAGKTTFEVWDVFDRGQPWLARHATARRGALKREGHDVRLLKELCAPEAQESQGKLAL